MIDLKDVPIKFRGVSIEDFAGVKAGDTIYGGCNHSESGIEIIDGNGICYEVECVAQLCGYDCDGNEVYEGDILVDQYGQDYSASLLGFGVTDDDAIRLDFDDKNTPSLRLISQGD